MDPLILALVGGSAAVVLVLLSLRSLLRKQAGPSRNYERRAALFTPAERSFLGVLDQAVGSGYRVFGKVRIADVLKVSSETPKSGWQASFNRINGKHFDFVLSDPQTLEVRAVIELNDRSHRSQKRAARDQFVRDACEGAGLRLIEVEAKRTYSVAEVRAMLATTVPEQPDSDGKIAPTISW